MLDPQILIIVAMFVVIFFFMIRPQQKKAKEQDAFLEEMKKGDRVVTSGGVIGKITNINDNIVTLSLDGKATCKFTKGAISKEMTDALNAANE